MPNDNSTTHVYLDLLEGDLSGSGWTVVIASNDRPYSYKYIGGNQSSADGSVVFRVGAGEGPVKLRLMANGKNSRRYRIAEDGVTFDEDPRGQLTAIGNAPESRGIKDKCTEILKASYKVLVIDTQAGNASIACDPMIRNQPT